MFQVGTESVETAVLARPAFDIAQEGWTYVTDKRFRGVDQGQAFLNLLPRQTVSKTQLM